MRRRGVLSSATPWGAIKFRGGLSNFVAGTVPMLFHQYFTYQSTMKYVEGYEDAVCILSICLCAATKNLWSSLWILLGLSIVFSYLFYKLSRAWKFEYDSCRSPNLPQLFSSWPLRVSLRFPFCSPRLMVEKILGRCIFWSTSIFPCLLTYLSSGAAPGPEMRQTGRARIKVGVLNFIMED